MKKSKLLLTLSFISVLSLTSWGNSIKTFSNNVNKSIKKVVKVEETTTITDKGIEVYKQTKNIDLHYEGKVVSGVVNIKEYNLSSNFNYVETTSSDSFEGESKNVKFSHIISKDYFEEYTLEKGVLIGKVSKDYAKEYFSVESIDCASSIDVSISLEEKNISSYAYSYLTSTNKTVSTNVIYSY